MLEPPGKTVHRTMKKKKRTKARTIAGTVITNLDRLNERKVINLDDIKKARATAAALQKTCMSDEELARLDPLHALYVYASNRLDILAEQIIGLPTLKKVYQALADADEIYMPDYPPMSPVTMSYFSCWSMFDLRVGKFKETIGEITAKVSRKIRDDDILSQLFEIINNSRMGLYFFEGQDQEGRGKFQELITGERTNAFITSGYVGTPGEVWLIRIFPGNRFGFDYSVVYTTPYIVGKIGVDGRYRNTDVAEDWQAFMERTLKKLELSDERKAYEVLMKYGLNRYYWNEYIFQGYAAHLDQAVFLGGIPDIPASLPHYSPDH